MWRCDRTQTSHHQKRNFTVTTMDTQKFLGLFQEILARELKDLPPVLHPKLILISGHKSSKKSDSDSPHRLLPSTRVTYNPHTTHPLRPGSPTPTISCHTGPNPGTKALEKLFRRSEISISSAPFAGHTTRRGAASETRGLPSHYCYRQDRFGEWGVAGCLQCVATSGEQSQRTTARSGNLPSFHKS